MENTIGVVNTKRHMLPSLPLAESYLLWEFQEHQTKNNNKLNEPLKSPYCKFQARASNWQGGFC